MAAMAGRRASTSLKVPCTAGRGAGRAREQLVPGTEARALAVGHQRQLGAGWRTAMPAVGIERRASSAYSSSSASAFSETSPCSVRRRPPRHRARRPSGSSAVRVGAFARAAAAAISSAPTCAAMRTSSGSTRRVISWRHDSNGVHPGDCGVDVAARSMAARTTASTRRCRRGCSGFVGMHRGLSTVAPAQDRRAQHIVPVGEAMGANPAPARRAGHVTSGKRPMSTARQHRQSMTDARPRAVAEVDVSVRGPAAGGRAGVEEDVLHQGRCSRISVDSGGKVMRHRLPAAMGTHGRRFDRPEIAPARPAELRARRC